MNWLCQYTKSAIGKKTIVAVTGLILVGFLIMHLLGNLQMFAGRGETVEATKMNAYAMFLKKEVALLWSVRIFLLISALAHIYFTISLVRQNRMARPKAYLVKGTYATFASRTMVYGGILLAAYIVYHLLHFTVGAVHPEAFYKHDVYQGVITSFKQPRIVVIYVFAMFVLFAHLYHGTVSLFQTLGVTNPIRLRWIKAAGITISILICGGFITIPVAVWIGWIQ